MSGFKKIIRWSLLLLLLGLLAGSGIGYWLFFKANVDTHGSNAEYLYVPTGTDFEGLVTILSRPLPNRLDGRHKSRNLPR